MEGNDNMCQKNGARCYNDSSKKLNKLTDKLNAANSELAAAQKALSVAGRKTDFRAFSKFKKQISNLEKKQEELTTEIRHTQRDVDSTRTGRKLLAEEIYNAKTPEKQRELDIRRRTAEGIRCAREHAGELAESGYQPAIRLVARAA